MNTQQPPFPQGPQSRAYHPESHPALGPHGSFDALDAPQRGLLQLESSFVSPVMNQAPPPHISPPNHHNGLPPRHHPDYNMTQVHSMPPHPNMPVLAGVHYAQMQQQPSSSQYRAGSPYAMRGADVFGGPMEVSPQPHPQGLNGDMMADPPVFVYPAGPVGYDYSNAPPPMSQDVGITPARLGPAPRLTQHYNMPGSSDSQVTPLSKNNPQHRPSTADGSSDNSSSAERPVHTETDGATSSDVEAESPTRRVRCRIPTFEHPEARSSAPQKRKAVPTAARSSAKLTKVAEDPGVEGIPPGPKPKERPSLSFAWMIGNAILASKAGGLSLEHIYRYISTCYPHFNTEDQWRNSVRHNLSIHKIFMTIPRSEIHPPGKGGIWTIPDDEKCHWQNTPEGPKFIKTFPPTDPHYATCRQTLWDIQVEVKAKAKAEAEGREYVPKKGKRAKAVKHQQALKQDSGPIPFVLPPPPQQMMGLHPPPVPQPHLQPPMPMPPQPMPHQPPMAMPMPPHPQAPIRGPPHMPAMSRGMSPPPLCSQDRLQLDDDGLDFEPEEQDPGRLQPLRFAPPKEKRTFTPLPSVTSSQRFSGQENRPPVPDEEGVFSTNGPQKPPLFRRTFEPASPADDTANVDISDFLQNDDDNLFETPAHKRQEESTGPVSGSSHNVTSSAFKTPALTHTSSSPTSSPMPPTVTRGAHHHPSGLQHEWTPAEEAHSNGPHSPAGLDAPFAMKPAPMKKSKGDDDDDLHLAPRAAERAIPPKTPGGAPRTPGLPPKTTGGPPKTPITRSSAAMRTPIMKTPLNYTTPGRPNFTPSRDQMSTPLWEAFGCLDRLEQERKMRLEQGNMTPLAVLEQGNMTPRPDTNPASYSLDSPGRASKDALEIDSPISKRRRVAS